MTNRKHISVHKCTQEKTEYFEFQQWKFFLENFHDTDLQKHEFNERWEELWKIPKQTVPKAKIYFIMLFFLAIQNFEVTSI